MISSSGRKRKIKAETFFYRSMQKQRVSMVREKLCVLCVITSIQFMITTKTTFVRHLSTLSSEETTKMKHAFFFFYSKT